MPALRQERVHQAHAGQPPSWPRMPALLPTCTRRAHTRPRRAMARAGARLVDRQLACMPIGSPEGRAYLGAMQAAANFAFGNRWWRGGGRSEEAAGGGAVRWVKPLPPRPLLPPAWLDAAGQR